MTTMKRGKKICNALRDVRRQIAAANDIPYETTDCHYEGDCLGTCPKCEAEVRYIENQLSLRRAAGKAVSLVGLSLGISAAWAANGSQPSAQNDLNSTAIETIDRNDTAATEEDMFIDMLGMIIERQPEFPGGEAALVKFIKDNLKYPADAARDSIQGRVTLSFVVKKNGSITNIEVMRSPDKRLTKEAIRIVKSMPRWKPAIKLDKPVRAKYVLPITFRLSDKPKNVVK